MPLLMRPYKEANLVPFSGHHRNYHDTPCKLYPLYAIGSTGSVRVATPWRLTKAIFATIYRLGKTM